MRDYYKKQGYFVLRSPKSGGIVDLVAIKKGEVLLIQCKIGGYLSNLEKQKLTDLAKTIGAKAILVWRSHTHQYPIQTELLEVVEGVDETK